LGSETTAYFALRAVSPSPPRIHFEVGYGIEIFHDHIKIMFYSVSTVLPLISVPLMIFGYFFPVSTGFIFKTLASQALLQVDLPLLPHP